MLAPTNPAHFRPQAFTARLLHRFATRILVVTIAALLIPSGKMTRSAKPGRVPNIVLILALSHAALPLACTGRRHGVEEQPEGPIAFDEMRSARSAGADSKRRMRTSRPGRTERQQQDSQVFLRPPAGHDVCRQ
jgi:hypothetical protein